MNQADLNYHTDGLFTMFYANTPAGADAWNAIAAQTEGTGQILTSHLQDTLRQLRAAGYSVRKQSAEKVDADALLAELQA